MSKIDFLSNLENFKKKASRRFHNFISGNEGPIENEISAQQGSPRVKWCLGVATHTSNSRFLMVCLPSAKRNLSAVFAILNNNLNLFSFFFSTAFYFNSSLFRQHIVNIFSLNVNHARKCGKKVRIAKERKLRELEQLDSISRMRAKYTECTKRCRSD